MTTASKPLPPHGTYARANGSPRYRKPCKCQPCLRVRRRADKHWRAHRALGRSLWIDASAAREHLTMLRGTRTWASIAAAGQLPESNLMYIANGQRTTIHRKTHARILAIKPLAKPIASKRIDALGSRRRLQALMAIGHSVRTIAAACRIAKDRAHDIAMDLQPTIRYDVAERIAAAYPDLAFLPPAHDKYTARTRNLAASRGWHGPLAWDDIDDPNCKPEILGRYENITRRPRGLADPDRIMRLTTEGKTTAEIARDLGVHQRTVFRARGRARQTAVAA